MDKALSDARAFQFSLLSLRGVAGATYSRIA